MSVPSSLRSAIPTAVIPSVLPAPTDAGTGLEAQDKARAVRRDAVPPTYTNVPSGEHERQVLDFCKADTRGPAPLVVHIHPSHSAVLGLLLEEKLKAEGDEVHLAYPGHKGHDSAGISDSLIAKLKPPQR